MRRLVALGVLVVGCAAGGGAEVTTSLDASATTPPESSSTTTLPEPPGSTLPDRELAPDFTLALGDGETFTLSEGSRPVFLVFWAEWCPVCRMELPVVDRLAGEYADRVDFVAPAWKSGQEAAITAAAELFPSGRVMWGLDPDEVIFDLYGVPYQPVTVLIGADRTVVDAWAGIRAEEGIRQAIEELIAIG
jgi:thiol-disulfide isomerase/thioredoxin